MHAYLHREEGDEGNAKYWYGRAGEPVSRDAHDAEWLSIVAVLLDLKQKSGCTPNAYCRYLRNGSLLVFVVAECSRKQSIFPVLLSVDNQLVLRFHCENL